MLHLDQPALKTIEHRIQQIPHGISFAQGALRIGGIDPSIREYAQAILDTDKADYYAHSLGVAALRKKLAEIVSAQFLGNNATTTIEPDNIAVTHGSINGIAALCLLLLDAGDEVLLPEPTYSVFVNTITVAKGVVTYVPCYKEIQATNGTSHWAFDLEQLQAMRTPRTKMLIIAHPANPCGVCMTQEEINKLAHWCESEGIYCIFDEAYENYFFNQPVTSSTALVTASKFLIRTGSFSKTYGMSGWRVGYVVASKEIIKHMAAIQDGLIVCPTVISQYAALYALDHPEIAQSYTQEVQKNRDLAHEKIMPLIEQGIVSCAKPPAGFFLFMQTKEHDTLQLTDDLVAQEQIALVPGRDFGPSGKKYMRLCYARKSEVLEEGLDRFVKFMQKK